MNFFLFDIATLILDVFCVKINLFSKYFAHFGFYQYFCITTIKFQIKKYIEDMNLTAKLLYLLLLWSVTSPVFASSASLDAITTVNKKFGKPTMEEMNMTEYAQDPEADAVILMQSCDVVYSMTSMYDITLTYNYKIRIKVLKDEGKKYGDFAISYYIDDNGKHMEEFNDFSAASYNLNEKGKIEASKVTSKLIRDERVGEHHMLRKFSVPMVQKGSVIEVSYRLFSTRYYSIYDFEMQKDLPIIYQKYFMEIPAVLIFNVEAPLQMSNVKSKTYSGKLNINSGADARNMKTCNSNCYELEAFNMPALRDVPYVWNVDDYAAKVVCDLKTTQFPNNPVYNVGMTWEQADKLILDQDEIGVHLNDKSKFKDELAASGISNIANEDDRIGAAVRFVASHVAWNGNYRNVPEFANTIVKKKNGSTADVNMMLINVFNDLGFTSYPVYISSRRNGRLPIHPTANAFNTFIVAVETSHGTCYVDGTDPYGAINVLDPNLYVTKGRKIGKKIAGSWVDLTKLAQHRTSHMSNIEVSADGSITGDISSQFLMNSAREFKLNYHKLKDSIDYVHTLQEKYGVTIDSLRLTGNNDYGTVVKRVVKFHKSAETTDDHIYVSPFVFNPIGDSPFKEETRELPIEMPTPVTVNYYVDVKIPVGYEAEECPKSYELTLPDRSMTVKMVCNKKEDIVRLSYTFICKKMKFESEEYTAVKKVYDMASQSMGDMIVFKKK